MTGCGGRVGGLVEVEVGRLGGLVGLRGWGVVVLGHLGALTAVGV